MKRKADDGPQEDTGQTEEEEQKYDPKRVKLAKMVKR